MAVYRVERTRDYTVMSNHHLKDPGLSLKAKGLLAIMLSLPDNWNYSTRGLAAICKEGVEAIGNALKELKRAGYVVRRQLRGEHGRRRRSGMWCRNSAMSGRSLSWQQRCRITSMMAVIPAPTRIGQGPSPSLTARGASNMR